MRLSGDPHRCRPLLWTLMETEGLTHYVPRNEDDGEA